MFTLNSRWPQLGDCFAVDIFTEGDVLDLRHLFETFVTPRRPEFRDPSDPIFRCRTFIYDPFLPRPHVLPVINGQTISSDNETAEVRSLLAAAARGKRKRVKSGRSRPADIIGAAEPDDEKWTRIIAMRRPASIGAYSEFDDLEYEFLIWVSTILNGIRFSILGDTPAQVIGIREPKTGQLDTEEFSTEWFGELIKIDFQRSFIYEAVSADPVEWKLRFSRVTVTNMATIASVLMSQDEPSSAAVTDATPEEGSNIKEALYHAHKSGFLTVALIQSPASGADAMLDGPYRYLARTPQQRLKRRATLIRYISLLKKATSSPDDLGSAAKGGDTRVAANIARPDFSKARP